MSISRTPTAPHPLCQVTFSRMDLMTKCVCGCFWGSHYFKVVPGGHMCSTCDSCDGFVAVVSHQGSHEGT
jgi:hypothetical protein